MSLPEGTACSGGYGDRVQRNWKSGIMSLLLPVRGFLSLEFRNCFLERRFRDSQIASSRVLREDRSRATHPSSLDLGHHDMPRTFPSRLERRCPLGQVEQQLAVEPDGWDQMLA